jgi:tripartite-type tricarboxylate transporter receptor subunit TctC
MRRLNLILAPLLLSVELGTTVFAVAAEDVTAFYHGKSLDMISSATPGSGYDNYARIVGRHIVRFLPGNPTIVNKSMPAASGLAQANYIYNQASKDGTVVGIITNNMTVEPLIGNNNARFDPGSFSWIGSPNRLINICVAWHERPVRTIEDLRAREWITGGTAARSSTVQQANTFKSLGGAKLKIVAGYAGTSQMLLALERGELDIACGIGFDSVKSSTDFYESGKIVPVMQLGYEKSPELPNTPFIYDMLLDQRMKPALDFITIRLDIGRAFAGPPGIPADRLAALRAAFWAAVQDSEFLAEAKKMGLDIDAQPGDVIQEKVRKLQDTPKDVIALADKIITNNGVEPPMIKR